MVDEAKNPQLVLIRRTLVFFYVPTMVSIALCSEKSIEIDWIVLYAPVVISIYLFWLYLASYISIEQTVNSMIHVKVPLLVNLLTITISCFLLLLFLRVDKLWDIYWGLVFLPFWVSILLYFCILALIVPHLGVKRSSVFLVLYGIAVTCTSILLVTYLDLDTPKYVCEIVSPIYVLSVAEAVCIVNENEKNLLECLFVSAIVPVCTLVCLEFMVNHNIPNFLIFLLSLMPLVIWSVVKEVELCKIRRNYSQLID